MTLGPGGNMWYAGDTNSYVGGQVASVNPTTQAASTPIQTAFTQPNGVTVTGTGTSWIAQDSQSSPNLWFTDWNGNAIGRYNPSTGAMTTWTIPCDPNTQPAGITLGPNGNMWFALHNTGEIGEIDQNGAIMTWKTPDPTEGPLEIVYDGTMLWFTESNTNKIGYFNPATMSSPQDYTLTGIVRI